MNIILCSHCDFLGNSALHVYALAKALHDMGHDCVMVMPGDMGTAPPNSPIPITSYVAAQDGEILFSNGAPPDVIHAWTPRAHVANLVRAVRARTACRYVVHMEDNEEIIVARESPETVSLEDLKSWPADLVEHILADPARTNPSMENDFVENADGYSCLVDQLLEFAPQGRPACVIEPGFDPLFEFVQDRVAARDALGIAQGRLVVTYCGNVHSSNIEDMRSLYAGLALVGRRRGEAVLLLRTGWDQVPFDIGNAQGLEVRAFGFVAREALPGLVQAADILIQPGRIDAFNAYRFPSKAPDYLVSGRPLILPDTNIGQRLIDGEHAIKLKTGDAFDIAECVEMLADKTALQDRIGSAGRTFAQQELTWDRAAIAIDQLYQTVLSRPAEVQAATAPKARFPVSLIAVVPSDVALEFDRRKQLATAGIQAVLSPAALEVLNPPGPTVPVEALADATAFEQRWSRQLHNGADYMIAAATEIAELGREGPRHAFVGAPDGRLGVASVCAYAQWLRLSVRHAFGAADPGHVFITGLDPILDSALQGDLRCEAILRATRTALVSGISLGVRPHNALDEAEFLTATTYRSAARYDENRESSATSPSFASDRPNWS